MKVIRVRRIVVTAVIILAAYVLQNAVFPALAVANIKPNLMLIITAVWSHYIFSHVPSQEQFRFSLLFEPDYYSGSDLYCRGHSCSVSAAFIYQPQTGSRREKECK